MDLMEFILENNVIIIAVVYVLGVFLKKLGFIKDKYIPFILLTISITFTLLTNDISTQAQIANAVMQGVIITGVAVLNNQLIKQSTK